jgi:hypothetical protein
MSVGNEVTLFVNATFWIMNFLGRRCQETYFKAISLFTLLYQSLNPEKR